MNQQTNTKTKLKYKEKSRVNLNLHSSTPIIVLHVRLLVMAVATLAIVGTFESRTVTFAVFFSTLWLFASASATGYTGWNAVEIVRVSKINELFRVVYLLNVLLAVLAHYTDATRVTSLPLCETLAVKFEAVDLHAFAALLLQRWTRWQVELLDGFEHVLILLDSPEVKCGQWVKRQRPILQQHIKEVLPGLAIPTIIIGVTEVDELERTRTGRGMSWWQFKITMHIWLYIYTYHWLNQNLKTVA